MADLTTEYFWHCITAEHWHRVVTGSRGTDYQVSYGATPRGEYSYDYNCSCHAFKFGGGKHCKHIEEVKSQNVHCRWMQFHDGNDVVEKDGKNSCPNCGLEVRSMGWGV